MTWFRVDDGFPNHPKVLALPRGAVRARCVGLWTLLGGWCASNLTDGHLPRHMVDEYGGTQADARRLVDVRLFETTPTGYLFHDWGDWNPLRAEVETKRTEARDRMRRNRDGRRTPPERSSSAVRANSDRTARAVTPTPTRPDPTHAAAAASTGAAAAAIDPPAPAPDLATDPSPVDHLHPAIDVLRSKLQSHTALRALRFDTLDTSQVERLLTLLAIHGDERLVRVALDTCRTTPPTLVTAFLGTWEALPPPGARHLAAVAAPACDKPGHQGTVRHCGQCASETKAGDAR